MPKARFYADENIEAWLVQHLRNQGLIIYSAVELGFQSHDDQFHLQEARKRKSILLTRDNDFLSDRKFPYHDISDTAIVIFKTERGTCMPIDLGYALVSLLDTIATSGRKNLAGLKVEIKGSRIIFHARIDGKIKRDEINISKDIIDRSLFDN